MTAHVSATRYNLCIIAPCSFLVLLTTFPVYGYLVFSPINYILSLYLFISGCPTEDSNEENIDPKEGPGHQPPSFTAGGPVPGSPSTGRDATLRHVYLRRDPGLGIVLFIFRHKNQHGYQQVDHG